MSFSEEIDVSLVCRLCTSNLMEFPECYSIDEELEDLVHTLLTIKFDHIADKSSLRLCINCYECVNSFNEFKQNAIETHENLKRLDVGDDHQPEEEEQDTDDMDADRFEIEVLKDESELEEAIIEYINPEYDGESLIIDDLETGNSSAVKVTQKKETEYAVEKILDEIEDKDLVQKTPVTKKSTNKQTSPVEREKGKEIYQKLLHKCHICSKMIEKNRLEGHINKHNNVRPFACSECGKTFYCKQLLRLHRTSIHTNIKLKCDQCDKFFPSSRALYAHTLRHKNQDRYICEMCDKKFNNSNSLKRHLAIHSGIREFVCTICGVGFYRKFNLDVHIKNVHHQTKEFTCTYDGCKKSFGYARLLKDHMKRHHTCNLKMETVEY